MSWLSIVRLGLVQASLGAIVVLVTSTLNRVMVVELALPALVPGALIALQYAVQVLRPRLGYGSDVGGRRTPWIVGGMAVLAAGSLAAGASTRLMAAHPAWGIGCAALAYAAVGLGVGAAGTSVLTLLAARVAPRRRAAAATIVWLMMIFGIAAAAIAAGKALQPFSPERMTAVVATVAATALALACLAVWGLEGRASALPAARQPFAPAARQPFAPAPRQPFLAALREIWAEPQSRRFSIFVFVAMLAYSAQELVLEPFAGAVFGLTPGETAGLTGLQHMGVLGGMALVGAGTMLAGEYRGRAMRAWTMGGCLASAAAALTLALCGLAGPGAPLQTLVVVLGAANGAFSVSAIGAMMGLASHGRSAREGTRMGLFGAAQALAFGAGGLAGTGLSDLAHLVAGSGASAYAGVFAAEAGLFAAAAWLAARVFNAHRSNQPAAPLGANQSAAPLGAVQPAAPLGANQPAAPLGAVQPA